VSIPVFIDRSVQYPDRYTITEIDANTVELVAEPGTVVQLGTPINATNLNAIGSQLKRLAGAIALGGIIG
jgi:archaellum component FlaG (FlaF/FlaG flagellin family)